MKLLLKLFSYQTQQAFKRRWYFFLSHPVDPWKMQRFFRIVALRLAKTSINQTSGTSMYYRKENFRTKQKRELCFADIRNADIYW